MEELNQTCRYWPSDSILPPNLHILLAVTVPSDSQLDLMDFYRWFDRMPCQAAALSALKLIGPLSL